MFAVIRSVLIGLSISSVSLAVAACVADSRPTKVGVNNLRVGDCYIDAAFDAADEAEMLSRVSCDYEHRQEAYHISELPKGPYPGEEKVEILADAICSAAFVEYVGIPYEDSDFVFTHLTPTSDGWVGMKDRKVVCLIARSDDNPTKGTARNRRI